MSQDGVIAVWCHSCGCETEGRVEDQDIVCMACRSEFIEMVGQDVASFLSSHSQQGERARTPLANTDIAVYRSMGQGLGVGDNQAVAGISPIMTILQQALGGGDGRPMGVVLRQAPAGVDQSLLQFGGPVHTRDGSQLVGGIGNSFENLLHHLMMNEASSRGPPPASADVIAQLERRTTNLRELGECSISQETFTETDVAVVLPCKHAFKEDLIVQWLQSHGTCPVCRVSITTNS